MSEKIEAFGLRAMGWAACKGGVSENSKPPGESAPEADRMEWMMGYAAALAEIEPLGEGISIEADLRKNGIEGLRLEALLCAAERLEAGKGWEEDSAMRWMRWPEHSVRDSPAALEKWAERMRAYGVDYEPAP